MNRKLILIGLFIIVSHALYAWKTDQWYSLCLAAVPISVLLYGRLEVIDIHDRLDAENKRTDDVIKAENDTRRLLAEVMRIVQDSKRKGAKHEEAITRLNAIVSRHSKHDRQLARAGAEKVKQDEASSEKTSDGDTRENPIPNPQVGKNVSVNRQPQRTVPNVGSGQRPFADRPNRGRTEGKETR